MKTCAYWIMVGPAQHIDVVTRRKLLDQAFDGWMMRESCTISRRRRNRFGAAAS